MANTIDFNVNTNAVTVLNQTGVAAENTAKGFKSAKQELRALQNQLLEMDQTSEEFKKASKRAAELKDTISDLGAEINANAGNAFEGLSNNVSLFGSRLMSLDLKGAGQALKGMGTAVSKIDFKTVKEEVGGLVSGFASLAKAIIANPIFLLAGILIGVIAYWKELNAVMNASDVTKLEKQKKVLEDEAKILEKQLGLEKAKGISNENTYNQEKAILQKKIQIATQEEKLARLKGDTDGITEAIKNKEQGIYDLKLLQAQLEGKINAGVEEAKKTLDAGYALQQKKNEAAKVELTSIESIKQRNREDAQLATQKLGDINYMNSLLSKQKWTQEEIIDMKNQGLLTERDLSRWMDDSFKARESVENKLRKGLQERIVIGQTEVDQLKLVMSGRTAELLNLFKSAKIKQDAVKSEEELAKIEEAKRVKEEAAAVRKAQREADAKKLADELLAIKNELADWDRRNLSDLDKELFLLNQRQKLEVETYKKAKKSAKETAALLKFHQEEEQAIRDKYAKIQSDKENQATQQRLKEKQQELIDLQTIIDTADESNFQATLSQQQRDLMASQDYYFNLISQAETAGLDTAALIEEQGRKENEIKDKYRKEDEAKQTATQEFRLKQLSESLGALSALNDAFTKKGQQQSKKQFQIQKALNLASAVVDTYGGINRALNDKTMPSTTARIIQASIVGAMGLANVLKISKTEYGNASVPSGTNMSAGGGDNGGTMAPSPANYDFISQQPNQQPPLQAYIVGSQVSSNLEAQQLIQNQSRLGG